MAADKKTMSLAQKLLELQKCVRGLAKDQTNQHFKYQFISGSKLLSTVRPKMDELGITLTQSYLPESLQILQGGAVYFTIRFVWTDSESGEEMEILWPAAGQNTSLDKAIGGAMTYAERYFILKQLHIATDEDDVDAQTPDPEPKPKAPAKGKAKVVAAPEQAPDEPKNVPVEKPHVTMQRVQAGNCKQIISYLVQHYNEKANDFPQAEKDYVRGRFNWDEDALEAVLEEAKKEAFRKSLNG